MSDAYIEYTHRFFRKWLPVYDGFALSIFWAYRAATRLAEPRPGKTFLDLCTGTGEIALRLARRGVRVIGVDVTPEMLEKARAKATRMRGEEMDLDIDFRLGDARALDLPEDAVDTVTISFALHDMPRAVRLDTLREALRVARERVVILDYDVGAGWMGRAMARAISLFESAYFPRFAREGGVSPLLTELGVAPVLERRVLPSFRIWVLDAAAAAPNETGRESEP